MNLSLLQTLTWSTVAGAVVSALALAATEPGAPLYGRSTTVGPQGPLVLPVEPTAAGGRTPLPAASAPGPVASQYAAH
jgi:hypothetical protein